MAAMEGLVGMAVSEDTAATEAPVAAHSKS